MIEDGARISITINMGSSFNAVDNIHNTVFSYSNGNLVVQTLPKQILLNHLHNWEDKISEITERRRFKPIKSYANKSDSVQIVDEAHYDFTITYKGKSANYTETTGVAQHGFNKNAVIQAISWCIAVVTSAKQSIDLASSIVRILTNYNLVVWKYEYNIMVHFRNAIHDGKIDHILLNGHPFEDVIIAADDSDLKLLHKTGILAMYPIDDTIRRLCGLP